MQGPPAAVVTQGAPQSTEASSSHDDSSMVAEAQALTFIEEYGTLIFAIIAYSSVSLAVVYFNWWLFTSVFKYPVFVSWIQQVIGLALFYVGSQAARLFPSLRVVFPATQFRSDVILKVVPLSISFVLTIGLANICLQKTLISTYQVARSLTLLFVILLSYLLLRERQTPMVLMACGLMVVGFVIGSLDPETLSLGGLVAGGFSSFFQSLYNVLIKKTMPYTNGDNQALLNYNVLLSSFLFIPMALVSEDLNSWKQALGLDPSGPSVWLIWGGMFLSGILGTSLNMTQYLVVKVTSPLTFNIIGFSKSLVQSVGGIIFMGDATSWESFSGLVLCMLGSGLYAKAKTDAGRQQQAAAVARKTPPEEDAELLPPPLTSSSGADLKIRVHVTPSPAVTIASTDGIPSPPSLLGESTSISPPVAGAIELGGMKAQ